MRLDNGFPYYNDPRKSTQVPPVQPPHAVPVPVQQVTPTVPAQPVTPSVPVQPVVPVQPGIPMQPMMPCPQLMYSQIYPYMMDSMGMGHAASIEGLYDIMDNTIEDIAPATAAASDPPPVLSNNPATASILLFKELTGFQAYGNPSGNADILYTGNRGTWTFDIPAYLFVPGNLRMQLVIRAVLDDHTSVPADRYSARITVNGTDVHNGRLALEHGRPEGGRFVNWRELTFNVPTMRRNTRVVIVNTSNTGPNDWIGFDWMQLRLMPR